MSALQMTRSTIADFEAVQVDTGPLALTLIPELGGKVASLRDQRTGREWLWRHPRRAYRRVPHGSSYVALADTGGWDECFPSVAACAYPSAPWAGAAIQDHGELWSQAAALEVTESAEQVTLRTRWQGVAVPYQFERALSLTAGSARVRVDYAVSSRSDAPLNYVWCIHPILAIEPGMQLQAPPAARFNCAGPDGLLPQMSGLPFPLTARGVDLSRLPDPAVALALKFWSDPLPADAGWAALQARDGALRMNWDVARLPQLALWMNFGAWAGDGGAPYFNLGLEPCVGAQDSLAEAVTVRNLYATLPPQTTRAWWLEIELTA